MAFGLSSGISRNRNFTVNVAEKIGEDGTIDDMTTHGGTEEKTEETYADSITNEAVNGQTGTTVISAHSLIESNTDYARSSKTTVIALAAPTTTT